MSRPTELPESPPPSPPPSHPPDITDVGPHVVVGESIGSAEPRELGVADTDTGFSFRMLLRFLLGIIAGTLAAVGVGWIVGAKPADVLGHAASVSPWVLLMCIGSGFVVLALQSLRWHAVMRPLLAMPYGQAYRAQLVGFLFNSILPARGGDFLRVQYLGRRTGKSRATILGTEVVDRWLDWWGWIPTFLVLCIVSHPPWWLYKALALFGALLTTWAVVMLVLTRRGFQARADTRLGRIGAALQTGIRAFRSRRTWAIAFLIAPLPWLWESIVISVAASSFQITIDWLMAFSVLIGFNLAMIVPSPGGVGVVESGGTAALLFFGADQSKAMAFMFVYHFSQLLPGVLGGVLLLVVQKEWLAGRKAGTTPLPSFSKQSERTPICRADDSTE